MEMGDWIDIVEGKISPRKKMVPYGLKDNDDTETLFWKDLPYYNLSKATVNKILKLINFGPEKEEETLQCNNCRKKHRASREVIILKNGQKYCNSCETIIK